MKIYYCPKSIVMVPNKDLTSKTLLTTPYKQPAILNGWTILNVSMAMLLLGSYLCVTFHLNRSSIFCVIQLKTVRHNLICIIVETPNKKAQYPIALAFYNGFSINVKRLFTLPWRTHKKTYFPRFTSLPCQVSREPRGRLWRHACYLLCLQNIFPPLPPPPNTPHRTGNRTGDLSGIPAANSTSTPRPKHMFCHDFQWGSPKFRLGEGSRSKTTPDSRS